MVKKQKSLKVNNYSHAIKEEVKIGKRGRDKVLIKNEMNSSSNEEKHLKNKK